MEQALAESIMRRLEAVGPQTRTQLRLRHKASSRPSKSEMDAALNHLINAGRIISEETPTAGRYKTTYREAP